MREKREGKKEKKYKFEYSNYCTQFYVKYKKCNKYIEQLSFYVTNVIVSLAAQQHY